MSAGPIMTASEINHRWIEHKEAFNQSMARAQAAYDAQGPPEEHDCAEDGHKWIRMPGEAKDGTRFARCVKCGLEAES